MATMELSMELAAVELRRLWLAKQLEIEEERIEKARSRLPKIWRHLVRELWSLHRLFHVVKTRYLLRKKSRVGTYARIQCCIQAPEHQAVLAWLRSVAAMAKVDLVADMPDLGTVESFLKLISVRAVLDDRPELVTASLEPLKWIPLACVPREEDRAHIERLIREYGLDPRETTEA